MQARRYLGRGALARFLGISESRVGQINPSPDAWIDERPAWTPEHAQRMKAEREERSRQRAQRRATAALLRDV